MNQDISEASKEYYLNVYYKCVGCERDRRELAGGLRGTSKVYTKEEAIKFILDCEICKGALYTIFRQETGYCETCRQPLHQHLRCHLCSILLGKGHLSEGISASTPDHPEQLWCGHCHVQDKAAARMDRGIDYTLAKYDKPKKEICENCDYWETVCQFISVKKKRGWCSWFEVAKPRNTRAVVPEEE